MTAAPTSNPSVRMAAPEHFERVRHYLAQAGYTDEEVCGVLKLESMSEVRLVRFEELKADGLPPALEFCLALFLFGVSREVRQLQTACPERVVESLTELGLLRPAKKKPGRLVCPVWLYPVDEFWVASDRTSDPDGEKFVPADDVVFPAIYGGTLRFLKLLPDAHGEEALDLCGGTGIGALCLSRTACRAFTADITERSARFAEFNVLLNGAAVVGLQGDLYAPVAGQTFGTITAHPPFVPALAQTMVYRDGGETGEDITRRVVEGLPLHLKPGGTAVVVCVGRDTAEQPFEARAAAWLGEEAGDFDVVFGQEKILSVEDVVDSMRKRGQGFGESEAAQLLSRLRSSHTRQFVYGALFFRRDPVRRPRPSALRTLRLHLSAEGRASDFERVLAWREQTRQPDFPNFLARSRPRLPAKLVLTARHVVQDGQLVPAEFIFSIEAGLEAALRPDPWIVPLLARFQGRLTVAEIFTQAAQAGELPPGFALEHFGGLVSMMSERGMLEVPVS